MYNGLIGFRASKNRKIIYNVYAFSSPTKSCYDCTGIDMLNLYYNHTKKDLIKIFKSIEWTNNINSKVTIPNINDECISSYTFNYREFLKNGFSCEYAYLYNMETDELEVYRGLFTKKQHKEQCGSICNGKFYYTNNVLNIKRNMNYKRIYWMFKHENNVLNYYDKYEYPEKKFIKGNASVENIYNNIYIEKYYPYINFKYNVLKITVRNCILKVKIISNRNDFKYKAYGYEDFWNNIFLCEANSLNKLNDELKIYIKNKINVIQDLYSSYNSFNKIQIANTFQIKEINLLLNSIAQIILNNKTLNIKNEEQLKQNYMKLFIVKQFNFNI